MESVSAGVSWERNHTRKEGGLLAPKMWSILASKLSKFRQPKPLLSAFWQINIGTKCYYYRRRLTLAGLSHPIPQLQPFFFLQKNEGEKHSGVGMYCSCLFYCHVCLVLLVWKLKECYAAVSIHIPLLFVLLLHNILSIQSNDNRIGEISLVNSCE